MSTSDEFKFKDNTAIQNRNTPFIEIMVDVAKILESWRESVFAHEWLDGEGQIKAAEAMSDKTRAKREAVEDAVSKGEEITKSVLGIGLLDNIEIGSARAEFLTLAALGHTELPVHIPASNEKEFKKFISKGS